MPSHIRISGNEGADRLSKSAISNGVPFTLLLRILIVY